jgi:inorganic pyrophosphatase
MKLPPTFVKNSDNINVIIETPKGSGIKYTFNPETELFKLSSILAEGLVFPFHFGFISGTKGDDGDPLDVLVLLDNPSYPGCHIECKVIGVIEAEQTEKKETIRNDRIIATAAEAERYAKIDSLKDLDKYIVDEIINFFVSYNKMKDKKFKPINTEGSRKAIKLIKNSML